MKDPLELKDPQKLRNLFGALTHDHIPIPGNVNFSHTWVNLLDDPMRKEELNAALRDLRMDFER